MLDSENSESIETEQIQQAIDRPIDCPTLSELANDVTSACIAVDDLARPTPVHLIAPIVIDRLVSAGIASDKIRFVVATGTHGSLAEPMLKRKLGEHLVRDFPVEVHDANGDLATTNVSYGDKPLRLNRAFFEADLKITIGAVLPHSFAGYSGGAKMMLPGLTDVTATARSHKFVQMGLRGGSDPDKNKFRLEIEDLARQMGLRFGVCVVPNARRGIAGAFAGDIVSAHRHASRHAADVFRTEFSGQYDAVILNAFPKDTDLIQAENVFLASLSRCQ